MHLSKKRRASDREWEDLGRVTVNDSHHVRECFVYLHDHKRCEVAQEVAIREFVGRSGRTSEWMNRSRKPEGTESPVTEELNVRASAVALSMS